MLRSAVTALVCAVLFVQSVPSLAGEKVQDAQPDLAGVFKELASKDETVRLKALQRSMTSRSVWADDLICRYAFAETKVADKAENRVRLFIACIRSHKPSVRAASLRAAKLWSDASADERKRILGVLGGLFEERYSGLRWHVLGPDSRKVLLASFTAADMTAFKSDIQKILGHAALPTPEGKALVKKIQEELKKPLLGNTEVLGSLFAAAAPQFSKYDKALLSELDSQLATAFTNLLALAKKQGWETVLFKCHLGGFLAGLARLSPALADKPRSLDAAEAFIAAALADVGKGLDIDVIDGADAQSRKKFVSWLSLSGLCIAATASWPPKYASGRLQGLPSSSELPAPFAYYSAAVRAREGDAKAKKELDAFLPTLVENVKASALEKEKATKSGDTKRASLHTKKLDRALLNMSMLLRISRPTPKKVASLREILGKVAGSQRSSGARELRKAMKKLSSGPAPKPVHSKAQEIAALKKKYRAKKIDLDLLVHGMFRLEALADQEFFQIYASASNKEKKEIGHRIAVCRMIGHNGGPKDIKPLYRYWLASDDSLTEAIVAAAAKRKYRGITSMVADCYPRMKRVSKRRICAWLLMETAKPSEKTLLFDVLASEKDARCLEFTALGIARLCRDGTSGDEMIRHVGASLKGEHYGQRWFYLASVLQSLVPDMKLKLDADTRKNIVQRNKEIDTAVREAIRRLETKKAAS